MSKKPRAQQLIPTKEKNKLNIKEKDWANLNHKSKSDESQRRAHDGPYRIPPF